MRIKSKLNYWLDLLRQGIRNWLGISYNRELILKNLEHTKRNADIAHKLSKQMNVTDQRTKDLVSIGVDVHFKEPHMILIYSKLNGGQLRHISVDLKDIRELRDLIANIEYTYGTNKTTWDTPPQFRGIY